MTRTRKAKATKQTEKYRHIRAWGILLGSMEYYIKSEQDKAEAENAPEDAIYFSHDASRWIRYPEVSLMSTKTRMEQILANLK